MDRSPSEAKGPVRARRALRAQVGRTVAEVATLDATEDGPARFLPGDHAPAPGS